MCKCANGNVETNEVNIKRFSSANFNYHIFTIAFPHYRIPHINLVDFEFWISGY